MNHDPVVIVSAVRTAMGGFQGVFGSVKATELGSQAIKAAIESLDMPTDAVDELYMGCVLPAGLGQAPARQAAFGAGLALSTPCTTVNKMCGSGMKATMLAYDGLCAGSSTVAVAGGLESMSNAPYLLPKARSGQRLGHGQVIDHMFLDGLEDAYEQGRLMGSFAEDCADHYRFSRDRQDAFAITSLKRAKQANQDGSFATEIAPVTVTGRHGETVVDRDEQPFNADLDRISKLKPAFRRDGTVTPANASSISDGAAALVLMRRSEAERRHLKPLAIVHGHTNYAQQPALFTTAPVGAIRRLLERLNWSASSVDLYEINEAFAVVTMAAMVALDLRHDKVNIHGAACALGHPIGASGARIIVTLLHALDKYQLKRGVASLCIGGGEATAIAIERTTP